MRHYRLRTLSLSSPLQQYEDYVPPTVDTQFGGFYINTGHLEFKPVKDVDVDSE